MKWLIALLKGELRPSPTTERLQRAAFIVCAIAMCLVIISFLK
jgi:hypothetical protein